ncbi:MAG TPA: undecaprenyldiphospho-muramoylpentapeptide beta-N-acetylglucosaminyltransferase [Firmicutes bacterium]|jgi:UDP-N-acetylglucosamine--N-acetylmuramyl-(pentapeptide) pyrophosphoryl-undecaprenol N-acetylglucosamine transferase|nr:undecaprenyldiphospho-muramoylpentapeptide beta-N-acetylglucosaminyltransferase [Bacillota bacterium]HAA38289.1 undecaprenyldiphospho-muramoylpentapeptide beta-N-acetylglucosaminyltransferase [Bacillota bacterium]
MRVIFTGGGTGGHIYPALALARYVQAHEGAEVLFVGTEQGMEKQIVPAAGFELHTIPVMGLERRLSLRLGRAVFLAAAAVLRARRLIRSFRPDVVVGTGGYVAGPVVLAARLAGVPTVIHEQNAIPGLTNVWLSRIVDRVCLSMPGSEQYFPNPRKTILTGNPRATEAAQAAGASPPPQPVLQPRLPLLLCVGGSHGALKLNEAFAGSLRRVLTETKAQVVYITGRRYYEELNRQLTELQQQYPERLHLLPYHDQLPLLLARADLMVSRAGATTLAELTALGVPCIVIPSPNVTNNHQEHNARLLADHDAAVLIREHELTTTVLAAQLVALLNDQQRLQAMAAASQRLGMPDAAARMTAVMRDVCR